MLTSYTESNGKFDDALRTLLKRSRADIAAVLSRLHTRLLACQMDSVDVTAIRDRVLVYHVVGRAGIVTIFYRVFAADLAQAIAVGDAVAQTVTIDAPMNRLSTNRILVGALLVWAAVGGITVAVIKLRRRA